MFAKNELFLQSRLGRARFCFPKTSNYTPFAAQRTGAAGTGLPVSTSPKKIVYCERANEQAVRTVRKIKKDSEIQPFNNFRSDAWNLCAGDATLRVSCFQCLLS